MSSVDTLDTVVAIVAGVLGVSSETARNSRRGDPEEWDSLKNIEIVFQIEEEFDIQFDEDDLPDLNDVLLISSAVDRLRGS